MPAYELAVSTTVLEPFDAPRDIPLLGSYGISALEVSVNCFADLQDRARFRGLSAAIRAAGIAVNSIHVPFHSTSLGRSCSISDPDGAARAETLDMARLCLERLLALGGRYLVIHPSTEPIADEQRQERIDLCLQGLEELASWLPSPSPVKIAVECLPRTCLGHDSTELLGILDAVGSDHIGVCLDVNHANLREGVVEATRRYGPRIISLHISDNDGLDERHWLPFRGVIPWGEWLPALREAGFGGPLLYEVALWQGPEGHLLEAPAILAAIEENAARLRALAG